LGYSVGAALKAADQLADEGASIEVIDLRSVVPLDADTVAESVAKTSRLLVVDEDYLSFGLSGEVITRVLERIGPGALGAVGRCAVPDTPVPGALSLEQAVIPTPARVLDAARGVLQQ
jgi:pyruvate dehydrogenase E1 component beta subunit